MSSTNIDSSLNDKFQYWSADEIVKHVDDLILRPDIKGAINLFRYLNTRESCDITSIIVNACRRMPPSFIKEVFDSKDSKHFFLSDISVYYPFNAR